MAEYQLVPYNVQFKVAGTEAEFRPLGDIDGKGTTAHEAILQTFHMMRHRERRASKRPGPTIEIERLREGARSICMTAQAGTTGMNGRLRKTDQTRVSIDPGDSMDVPLRHLFLLPSAGSTGLLLAERFGRTGLLSLVKLMLTRVVGQNVNDVRVEIHPSMSESAMQQWAKHATIKGLNLRQEPSSSGWIHGVRTHPVFSVTAPRKRWHWSDFGGFEDASHRAVMTQVVPALPKGVSGETAEQATDRLLEEGWRVSMKLERDHVEREYFLDMEVGLSLTFPMGGVGRASNSVFKTTAKAVITELQKEGIAHGVKPEHCDYGKDTPQVDKPWKGDWGVDPSSASEPDSGSS